MTENFFLRTDQQNEILKFMKSKNKILHIIGIPGTGKTLVVKETLKKYEYTYINYLENTSININSINNTSINKSNNTSINKAKISSIKIRPIVVLDEFDKFYENDFQKCQLILNNKKINKIITISNNLLPNFDNVLIFPPYTTDEISFILKKKRNLSDSECKLISKYCADGDLRKALNYELKDNKAAKNIHIEIIKEIFDDNYDDCYNEYVNRCQELKLKFVGKDDFEILCDIIDES
ncbi:Cell division control protein 6 like protein [Dictyocoela muelleri]|nr:Cell division control protein 6 like protein [Dictyocoela muelleri]